MADRMLDLDELLSIVDDEATTEELSRYFGTRGGVARYTGRRFEGLAGGGDQAHVANEITADDLVAVEMLSVQVPAEVAIDLLEGDLGPQITEDLREIPTDVAIGDPDAKDLLSKDGSADRLWRALKKPDGMGWVTAGKLLARKRPRLVPVYDRIARCALGYPDNVWLWLHDQFSADNGALRPRLESARASADVPETVTPLRVLDVILWMRHRPEHRATACPGMQP